MQSSVIGNRTKLTTYLCFMIIRFVELIIIRRALLYVNWCFIFQVAFKVYNKSKPQKYGVLFKSINAVEYPYTFVAHCYAGSPEGKPNQFYVKGTDEYTKYLVKRLAEEVPLTGRNLTMDRLVLF